MKTADSGLSTLDKLPTGQSATVSELTSEGAERRRMMDLGILPGAQIETVMKSPLGDPTVYRVRGSSIALRREQAGRIRIDRGDNDNSGEQRQRK